MFSPVPSSRQPGLLLASLSRRSSSSVGTHCHHYTTGATLPQNSFSYKSIFYIQVFRIKSFLLSFSELSSPAPPIAIGSFSSHRSSYDKSCETLLCKLFSGNFSVSESFQLFSDFQDGGGEQQLALRGHHRLLPHPHNPGLESAPCPGQKAL